jgi:ATP-dependent RNA helicase DDX18/HAS1
MKFNATLGIGKAFGFSVPPRVDLNFSARGDKSTSMAGRKRKQVEGEGEGGKNFYVSSGHAFSADNPYGKKVAGDKRQFSR